MRIISSSICTAHEPRVIGSKVIDPRGFMAALEAAVAAHNFAADRFPGQALISVPAAIPFVSSGVGRPKPDPSAYTLKLYRGTVSAYLKREHAAPVEGLACVVYTRDAYLNDPDVQTEERERLTADSSVTHVLVAVLAEAGARSQLSPYRFAHNLAGGNREAQLWSADEIRAKARDIIEYAGQWATVADD
jgi:hypothetical protein